MQSAKNSSSKLNKVHNHEMLISLANLNYTLGGMWYKKNKNTFWIFLLLRWKEKEKENTLCYENNAKVMHDNTQLNYKGYTNKKYQFLN